MLGGGYKGKERARSQATELSSPMTARPTLLYRRRRDWPAVAVLAKVGTYAAGVGSFILASTH
jgi:hypothetical protein